jgi:hypothetical protein
MGNGPSITETSIAGGRGSCGGPRLRHQGIPRDEDAAQPGAGAEAQGDSEGVDAVTCLNLLGELRSRFLNLKGGIRGIGQQAERNTK